MWSKDYELFRAQLGCDNNKAIRIPYDKERMIPKSEFIKNGGRCNIAGQAVMYLSTTEDSAISELRPWMGEMVSVATFKSKRDLKLLNLRRGAPDKLDMRKLFPSAFIQTPKFVDKIVWEDIDRSFSRPVSIGDQKFEYIATQILFQFFIDFGFDGIIYTSQFGEGRGCNIVINDPEKVEFIGAELYQLKNIIYELRKIIDTPIENVKL